MHLVQDHRRNNIMPVYRKSAGRKANKNFNKKKLNKNLVTNTTSAFGEKPKNGEAKGIQLPKLKKM